MRVTPLGKDPHFIANMVEVGDAVYFVDSGPSIADAIVRLGKEPASVRAVFTTQSGFGRTAGIPAFADLVNWAWRDCFVRIFFATEDLLHATERLLFAFLSQDGRIDRERLRFSLAAAGRVYEDELVTVCYIATDREGGQPTYAILMQERASGERTLFLPHGEVLSDDGQEGFCTALSSCGGQMP